MPKQATFLSIRPVGLTTRISARRPATHLYLRGNIYYFRYAFPQKIREALGQSEIRISLRTGFLKHARILSRQLWSCVEGILLADQESAWHEIIETVNSKLKEIVGVYTGTGSPAPDLDKLDWLLAIQEEDGYVDKGKLQETLKRKLKEEFPTSLPPTPISVSMIRSRMERLLVLYLDEMDAELYDPASQIWIDNSKSDPILSVSDREWLEHEYDIFLKPINNSPKKLVSRYFPSALHELVAKGLFTNCEFSTENILFILEEFHKVKITINRILIHRTKGEYGYERKFRQISVECNTHPHVSTSQSKIQDMMLSEFISKFIETKIKDGDWTERNIPTHKNRVETLLDVIQDVPVVNIDRTMIRDFRDILVKLPPNRKKKEYRGKSIQELKKINHKSTLNVKTINVTLQAISGMFEWGIREGLLENNPAEGLTLKDDRHPGDLREPFTEAEIKTIFFSGDYTPEAFKNPAYYWVPLIALYTGMRLEEICQLHTSDIYQEDDISIIDIGTKTKDSLNDKILKNKNATRKIPIHPDLIKLGLLDYQKEISDKSNRMFPLLNKTEKTPKYGKQVSKHFSSWLKTKKIDGKKSFHSLRHTFSDFFKKRNLQTDIFTQVFGHEQTRLAVKQYGSKFSVCQCYDKVISQIEWQ